MTKQYTTAQFNAEVAKAKAELAQAVTDETQVAFRRYDVINAHCIKLGITDNETERKRFIEAAGVSGNNVSDHVKVLAYVNQYEPTKALILDLKSDSKHRDLFAKERSQFMLKELFTQIKKNNGVPLSKAKVIAHYKAKAEKAKQKQAERDSNPLETFRTQLGNMVKSKTEYGVCQFNGVDALLSAIAGLTLNEQCEAQRAVNKAAGFTKSGKVKEAATPAATPTPNAPAPDMATILAQFMQTVDKRLASSGL